MKKVIFAVAAFIALSFTSYGQAPEGFKYQAVVRDASNLIITNQGVGMQIIIHQGSVTGTAVYTETFATTSNGYGLVNLEIGTGTSSDDFSTIDWSAGPFYIETLADLSGGTTYSSMGTSQLMSVPYALYAKSSGNGQGPAGPAGADGLDGAPGATGPQGPAGANGLDGAPGATGPQGPAGANGLDGATGAAGPQGPIGLTGVTGPQGPAGANGLDGAAGATGPAGAANMSGTADYVVKFTGATTGGNSTIRDNGTGVAINAFPSSLFQLFASKTQLTADGDGQATVYGYRSRDSQNDGVSYATTGGNSGVRGYNFWGDLYTFGVTGTSYNDYTRTGGVMGAQTSGTYWGSLGYKNSASATYGVYGSAGYASGAGFLPTGETIGIGGGFFGDLIGSTSQGSVIGQMNSGDLFAQYNSGNVYTKGQNIELVATEGKVTPMYAVTSTEATVYAKGTINLVNGSAHVSFDAAYALMLGGSPVVTATPNGECNGLYVASVDAKGFTVKELMGGTSSATVSWISVGNRVDNNPVDRATAMVSSPNFERNVQQVLYSDGHLEGAAKAIWWDGTSLRFDEMPAHLTKVDRSEK